jgi:hypothetical protein
MAHNDKLPKEDIGRGRIRSILSAIDWIQIIRSGHCVGLLQPRVNRDDTDTGLDVLKLGDTRLNIALAVA